MNLNEVRSVYFLGIGGIGMSALARYFLLRGAKVAGYDRTRTPLTALLNSEGMKIHYAEDLSQIPEKVDLVVFTPAIPSDHKEYQYFLEHKIPVKKRSEVLGMISHDHTTLAVAGTHGKTTTSTLLAHIIRSAGYPHLAFLGGISKNYDSNFFFSFTEEEVHTPEMRRKIYCITEADEFDRSFLRLTPDTAIITSADADHLDIYKTAGEVKKSFSEFTGKIREQGFLILKAGVDIPLKTAPGVRVYRYGLTPDADFHADRIRVHEGRIHFDLAFPDGTLEDLTLGLPGRFNVENAVAASAAALLNGVSPAFLAAALENFEGVRRRFDYQIRRNDFVYIDDYAHHPEELKACITAVRELFPGKKITGIFQPHLFTRTRDFIDEFAGVLGKLDELYLLPIYPAREKPIPGITSEMLLNRIKLENKHLIAKKEVVAELLRHRPEVLLTLGAGDIDQLVTPVRKAFEEENQG